jgi:uncharacterized protein YfaS (alpha-2-macroglobulin family)
MRSKLIAVVLLLAALVGGWWLWEHRDASTGPGTAGTDAFVVVDAADRALDGAPAIALTFSQPLDPKGSYDKFVQVFEMPLRPGDTPARNNSENEEDPDRAGKGSIVSKEAKDTETAGGKAASGAWVVGDNPRLLYFPHVKPETRYVVRVAVDLPARSGTKLATEARYSIRTAAVSPAYYFASRGNVLPAKQNGGLPVVSVNVPEVDVQFLRVKPDQLANFLEKVIAPPRARTQQRTGNGSPEEEESSDDDQRFRSMSGAVGSWDLDRLHRLTQSVYSARFITEQRANRRSVTFLPVEEIKELQEPGIYVAVMSQPGRFRDDFQVTYFYVSDLGLHLREYSTRADGYVSSLTTGKAVKGVDVSWLDTQGKVLVHAQTDSDGRATFADRPKTAKVVVARRGQQMSIVALHEPALDLSEFDTGGLTQKAVRLFAYSGRNLYRPGETFDLSVIARDTDGKPVAAQPVQAVLKRPDGKTQFTATWQGDAAFAGYYRRRIELPGDAPTGSWTLELRSDPADRTPGTEFRFGVEEFLPERMKLDLASKTARLAPDTELVVDAAGAYLYGAPAAGNRLLGVVQLERARNPLAAKLPGFEFGDTADDGKKSREEIPETQLDAQGKASVKVDIASATKRGSPYAVRATFSLLESGGRPVVRTLERIHWPAPVLVGVRPLFTGDYARENAPASFEVVRADGDANLKAGKALPVRLFREDRNYYWRFDDQRGWHSGFTETDELVETASVDIPAGGRGKLTVPVRYGRYRLEILDAETGQTLRFRFYAGWSARADESQGVRPDRVALKLDKPAYREGDTAQLTLTPPHAGEALVTVEGDRTLWVKRMTVPAGSTTLSVPIDKSWTRHDLYVSVLVLRPGAEGDRITPARAMGLVHVPLERTERKLTVNLEAPQKMQPELPLKVKVKAPDAKGEKAMVTVYAVDVGILNITRYASPDPFGFFFGKMRYGADLHDVYGRLIEKMAGQKGRLRYGGDNTPKATRSLPKKVKLVDLFSGPVALDERGEAEVTLNVPDFNGTLRLMAVVAGTQRFGAQESEITVAAPVVAELATPRFLTFGDTATVALDLHNLSGAEQKLQVRLAADNGLRLRDAERAVTLKDQQKATLRFAVEAGTTVGLAEVRVQVDGGPAKLLRSFALQVQAPTPQQQVMRRYTLAAGETVEIKDAELGGLHRGTVAAHVAISGKPPIDVRTAIKGLLSYPYGCAEQTTSTAYPHVFVDEEAARQFGLKPFSREQRVEMLDRAIARLGAMQAANGGFSLWGNVSEYEYWLSGYVTSFLQDARAQGFGVPEAMHRKGMDFLLKGLQEGVSGLPRTRPKAWDPNAVWNDRRYAGAGRFAVLAQGGYVLARESKAPLSTLRQLHESRALAHSGLALVHLGLALRLMGDEARGDSTIAEGISKVREDGYWWGDYGSALRDAALSYALLDRHKLTPPNRENLLATVGAEMSRSRYASTQEKMALFLVGRSLGAAKEGAWNAEVTTAERTDKVGGETSRYVEVSAADLATGVRVTNRHAERLYLELAYTGHPVKSPAPRSDVFNLVRELYAADGTPIGDRALRVGESVMVRINVKARSRIANGLVVDRIPAGLEIENLNIVQGEQMGIVPIGKINPAEAMADRRIQHVEFRDDRFVAAVRIEGELNLFYRARVVTPGRFVVPPLYAEDMYRPDVYGIAGGSQMLTVVDSKSGEGGTQ